MKGLPTPEYTNNKKHWEVSLVIANGHINLPTGISVSEYSLIHL